MWVIALFVSVCAVGGFSVGSADPTYGQDGQEASEQWIGPGLGHVSSNTAFVWARCITPDTHSLRLTPANADESPRLMTVTALPSNDLCVVWKIGGLRQDSAYTYSLEGPIPDEIAAQTFTFRTAPAEDAACAVGIAFGSCADEGEGTGRVWDRIAHSSVDSLVLLGDTPYIDSTKLDHQRKRYRQFNSAPAFERLFRQIPVYGTWDDHDFGRNDTDGNLPGKSRSRNAFMAYRPNPTYGETDHGIYTSFRRGAIEVFLLDTRYFAATEPSPFDPDRLTLLGAAQWAWLTRGLQESTAPFKVLACGMIWNEATRPGKIDHWGTFAHERDALFKLLGEHNITGVVLVGGDVHRSRVIRHDSAALAGYNVLELIASPLHHRVIEAANAPHPGLVWDAGEPHSFMMLRGDSTVSPATLKAQFINADGDVLIAIDVSAAK